MAVLAQGLERTRQEPVPIAVMGRDVIGHGGHDDEAACLAHPTERLGLELMTTETTPAL
jgi:hypothetical protein